MRNFSVGLFNSLTGCIRKGNCPGAVVFGKFFKPEGISYNHQLFPESIAVFAHQQVHGNHHPVMNRKGSIHGQGYFL